LRVAQTGMLKQMAVTPFDRALYADAARTLGLDDYLTLHPAWMYQTLQPFWSLERGVTWAERRLRFGPLPAPAFPLELPERYAAVQFYARGTWQPDANTAAFARETIALVARQIPVVLLALDLHMDDHVDFIPRPLPANVTVLGDLVNADPQTSLMIRSAAVARAAAFVGTYGGTSHLALRYGVPSVNLYTQWAGVYLAHRQLSEAVALQMRIPYHVVQLNEIPILQDVLPRVTYQAQTSSGAKKPVASQPAMV
jgi:hypothetical protein